MLPIEPLLLILVENALDRVAVDCVGPLLTAKSARLVVSSDYLTKWPGCFAVPTIDATVHAKFVNEIIGRHATPGTLLSDHGQNFSPNF